jgi:UDP-3-O-[3-hydroxymyristoyl] glucosamine N-acyltransferase
MRISLAELANQLDVKYVGDGDCLLEGIARLEDSKPGDLTFVANAVYEKYLPHCQASAVILSEKYVSLCPTSALVCTNPYLVYAKAAEVFQTTPSISPSVHPSSLIGEGCKIPDSVSIAGNVVIEDHVQLGENSVIGPGCVIGEGCEIGCDSILKSNVTLYPNSRIGERTLLHSGCVVGSDGFGNAFDKDHWVKVPQLGGVKIGNDVEIGANTCIDRGSVGDTLIGDGVRLDNLIQIAHNVSIGDHTVIAAGTGVAGSATIGRYCMIGGNTGISGHIFLTDKVQVGGMSAVTRSIVKSGSYVARGFGLQTLKEWAKTVATLRFMLKKIMKGKK